jgi:hypothetical protein
MGDHIRVDFDDGGRAAASPAERLQKLYAEALNPKNLDSSRFLRPPGDVAEENDRLILQILQALGCELEQDCRPDRDRRRPELLSQTEKKALDEQAKLIARTIDKNGDFYAGLKRERIEEAFNEATKAGLPQLKYLVDRINENIQNPDLKLCYSFWQESVAYQKDAGNLAVYYRPFTVSESRSTVWVDNLRNGEQEDRISSSPHAFAKGYFRLGNDGDIDLENPYKRAR